MSSEIPSLKEANAIINNKKNYLRSDRRAGSFADAFKKPDEKKALVKSDLKSEKKLDLKPEKTSIESSELKTDTPSLPEAKLPDAKVEISDEAKEVAEKALQKKKEIEEIKKAKEIQKKSLKHTVSKPGVFFLGGAGIMSVGSVTGSYSGMKDMADYVEGARYYGWDQKSEILEEIDKRKADQPIVLVGHSLGGDTIVEIANELNTLDHGYRKVDLLFTIDSFGMNNDLIPANVAKNIHYFSDKNLFLNDGPNWAKNEEKTTVENNLLSVDHTDLDDNHDVQAHILSEIEAILA